MNVDNEGGGRCEQAKYQQTSDPNCIVIKTKKTKQKT